MKARFDIFSWYLENLLQVKTNSEIQETIEEEINWAREDNEKMCASKYADFFLNFFLLGLLFVEVLWQGWDQRSVKNNRKVWCLKELKKPSTEGDILRRLKLTIFNQDSLLNCSRENIKSRASITLQVQNRNNVLIHLIIHYPTWSTSGSTFSNLLSSIALQPLKGCGHGIYSIYIYTADANLPGKTRW